MTVIVYTEDKINRYLMADTRILAGSDIYDESKIFQFNGGVGASAGVTNITDPLQYFINEISKNNDLSDLSYLFGEFRNHYLTFLRSVGIFSYHEGNGHLILMTDSLAFEFAVGTNLVEDEGQSWHAVIMHDKYIGSGASAARAAYLALAYKKLSIKARFREALSIAASIESTISDTFDYVEIKKKDK